MTQEENKNNRSHDELESLLTTKDVAKLMQVSERHVPNLVARGQIPQPIRLGRVVRYRRADIRRFLNGESDNRLGA